MVMLLTTMMPRFTLALLILFLGGAEFAPALRLRGDKKRSLKTSHLTKEVPEEGGDSDADLEEALAKTEKKWNAMDDFLEIMFTIACRWKHDKDVHGLASHKLKKAAEEGKTATTAEHNAFLKSIHAKNVKELEMACGKVDAVGMKKCRQGCQDRHHDQMEDRDKCDTACEKSYKKFESTCKSKADDLNTIYDMEMTTLAAKQGCLKDHCEKFPTVYTKEKGDAQKKEVDERCEKYCTEDNVKVRCEQKFALESDMMQADIKAKCNEKHGSTSDCLGEKKEDLKAEDEKCTGDKEKCASQHDECMGAGEADQVQATCDARKKMCEEQVTEACLKKFKAGLEAATEACGDETAEATEKCEEETMKEKEEEEVKSCVEGGVPKCDKDCHKKCDVEGMNTCLDALAPGDQDPTNDFCNAFWGFIRDSSQIDPVTGDPIALLSPSAIQRLQKIAPPLPAGH